MKHLSLSQPHVIVMTGIPGSGKTFFAEKFAETFHAPYVNREKILAAHSELPTKAVDAIVLYQLDELLKTKQTIIFEGPSDTKAERLELAKRARNAGYETLFVLVQTEPATAKMRSTKELKNKLSRTLAPEEFDRISQRFSLLSPQEKPVVISGKHTYATQAKVVLKRLSSPRAAISTHPKPPMRPQQSRPRNITIR